MKAKFAHEAFKENSDPIEDMGIGHYGFLKQAYNEIGNTLPPNTYKKYFGKNSIYDVYYIEKVYILYYTLENLLQKNEPNDAFEKAKIQNEAKLLHIKPNRKLEIFNHVKEVLENYFYINILEE